MRCEVAILGAGPAGTAAAAACARAGLDTIVVDPAVHRSWRPTYAAWYDELERVGLQHCVQNVYEQVVVHTTRTHLWDRAYARVNGDLLRQTLSSRAENDGARFVRDSATSASWGEVSLRSGRTITARVVLDATGGRSGLQHRAKAKLFQVAWGVVLDVQHGMDPNRAVFMDWSERHEDTPSFLYALPIGEGRIFVEETQLVGPDVGYEVLAQRLMARIERRSWSTESMGPVETCRIPMDVSPTNQVGPAVPIGAAGGWVHPATGYQLGSALFRAEGVAKQIVESMGMSHRAQAQALLSFLSPRGAMLRQGLHRFGRDLLLDRNTHELRVLFDAFFSLPDVHRRAWLDADAPVADVAVAMLTLFSLAPWRLRADLARGLVQHQGLDLARSLFPASLAPHFGGNA